MRRIVIPPDIEARMIRIVRRAEARQSRLSGRRAPRLSVKLLSARAGFPLGFDRLQVIKPDGSQSVEIRHLSREFCEVFGALVRSGRLAVYEDSSGRFLVTEGRVGHLQIA